MDANPIFFLKGRFHMKNNIRTGMITLLSAMLVCVMALVGTSLTGTLSSSSPAYAEGTAITEPASDPSPAIYVAEKNANSVVGIVTNQQTWSRTSGTVEEPVAEGSGVVIAEGGYVLTNYHVIEDGSSYQVLMPSGDKVDATLVGSDSSMDLAVLKVDGDAANELVPVSIGSTDSLKVGSTVIAIGNPGGEVLANTTTQGIVSALERTSATSNNTTRRVSYIQHDAAINSGNSGGGLFNYKGELVGINTLKYSGSAYSGVTFEGLGFAIPVEAAMEVAQDLMQYGKVIRPALGVTVSNFTEGPDEPMPNNAPVSVIVQGVNEGGAAAKAGIQQYDFIYAVDGERVSSMLDLTGVLDEHEVGDTVTVTVVRYAQAGYVQSVSSFGYYSRSSDSAEFRVSGGYEMIDIEVTLEELE